MPKAIISSYTRIYNSTKNANDIVFTKQFINNDIGEIIIQGRRRNDYYLSTIEFKSLDGSYSKRTFKLSPKHVNYLLNNNSNNEDMFFSVMNKITGETIATPKKLAKRPKKSKTVKYIMEENNKINYNKKKSQKKSPKKKSPKKKSPKKKASKKKTVFNIFK